MQTQTTGTATMTANTQAAAGRRLIVNPATGTVSTDDRAGAEFRAQERAGGGTLSAYRHRDYLVRTGMPFGDAQSECKSRLASVAAEYEAEMARIAAEYDVTPSALGRYLAGLARLDAAVRAGCELCGGELETVRDFGSTFVQCTSEGCYWCKSTEAH